MDTLRPICSRCNQRSCKPSKKYKSGFIKFCSSCEQKHYGIWETRKTKEYHKRPRRKKRCERVRLRYIEKLRALLGANPGELVPCSCGFVPTHMCQMDVDHIDRNRKNNDPSNLQLICSNCHRLKTYIERH